MEGRSGQGVFADRDEVVYWVEKVCFVFCDRTLGFEVRAVIVNIIWVWRGESLCGVE